MVDIDRNCITARLYSFIFPINTPSSRFEDGHYCVGASVAPNFDEEMAAGDRGDFHIHWSDSELLQTGELIYHHIHTPVSLGRRSIPDLWIINKGVTKKCGTIRKGIFLDVEEPEPPILLMYRGIESIPVPS
mgnify:CR=1 FL=1